MLSSLYGIYVPYLLEKLLTTLGGAGSVLFLDENVKEVFLRNLIIGFWMLVT